ncbi:MAG: hypothetical protein V4646_05670 [Pseudomonadota bacterium]
MSKLSRPALIISACIFVCALIMLCMTQTPAAPVLPVELGQQAAVASVHVADASTLGEASTAEAALADLSPELSEPMLPVQAALLPGVRVARPAAPVALALPQPLIEGPQRPPRTLQA